ncbi:Ribokinase-like protein [Phascolomyces articulosus]|uniref:Ribokinase-like protein n=1 Tax=Phascolomyces articulosus TaxID=60185 RepID=A0AAD5KAE3_9FUNG|nr:Ribokinase-like protein [Phascolomyces articulosus]
MVNSTIGKLIVIGGVALDMTSTISKSSKNLTSILHTSNPGHIKQTLGGVGRNVCEAAVRTGAPAFLVSAVGNDLAAQTVRQGLKAIGMSTQFIQCIPNHPTAVYNAIHSKSGELIAAVADMDIFDTVDPIMIDKIVHTEEPSLVCFDGNITAKTMSKITAKSVQLGIPVFFEPTSVPKSLKIFERDIITSGAIKFISPNQFELEAMSETARALLNNTISNHDNDTMTPKAPALVDRVLPYAIHLSHMIPNVITKLGEEGCLYVGRSTRTRQVHVQYFEPEKVDHIVNVTGAGDCFVGTLLANLRKHITIQPDNATLWKQIISRAQRAAILTLQSDLAVSPYINDKLLYSK